MDLPNPFQHKETKSEKIFRILIQIGLYVCIFLAGYIAAKLQTLLSTF